MKHFIWTLCLLSMACAQGAVPIASGSLDGAEIDDGWSHLVVTVDPDGEDRVTRIWLASVDGEVALRTGDSRWWANLQRDPEIRIRVSGSDHPYRAEFPRTHEERVRIDEAFLEKYGGWERMMFSDERGETHENYAWLRRD